MVSESGKIEDSTQGKTCYWLPDFTEVQKPIQSLILNVQK
jgi:hypothetical protein